MRSRRRSKADPAAHPFHDWRNPNMPVPLRFQDGSIRYVAPAVRQEIAAELFAEIDSPLWRFDPTYNLNRKKRT